MSDPFLDFLMTRDRRKVMAEARPVSLQKLYAEASTEQRQIIDEMPIGELRRRLAEAEPYRTRKVRVLANSELLENARRATERARVAESKNKELRALLDASARSRGEK